jgi:hypothetical protein
MSEDVEQELAGLQAHVTELEAFKRLADACHDQRCRRAEYRRPSK